MKWVKESQCFFLAVKIKCPTGTKKKSVGNWRQHSKSIFSFFHFKFFSGKKKKKDDKWVTGEKEDKLDWPKCFFSFFFFFFLTRIKVKTEPQIKMVERILMVKNGMNNVTQKKRSDILALVVLSFSVGSRRYLLFLLANFNETTNLTSSLAFTFSCLLTLSFELLFVFFAY